VLVRTDRIELHTIADPDGAGESNPLADLHRG